MKFFRKLVPDPLDVVFIAGLAAVVFGVYHIYRPAAWIVGGALAAGYSWLASAGRHAIVRMKQMEETQTE